MTTSKLNTNPTSISKLETTPNLNTYNRDVIQQRTCTSKRTSMINNLNPLMDNNTTILNQSKTSRTTRQKDKCENTNLSLSKPESASEDIYTTPSNFEDTRIGLSIKQKQQVRQDIGDYIRRDPNEDADEESTTAYAIIRRNNKTPHEHTHQSFISSNNSAIHVQQQQQGMGDHYHTSTRQHRTRSKTAGTSNRKYHRSLEQQDFETSLDEKNAFRWRIFMYFLIMLVVVFVIYRFVLAVWPKRKKTLMEQFIDDIYTFFTP